MTFNCNIHGWYKAGSLRACFDGWITLPFVPQRGQFLEVVGDRECEPFVRVRRVYWSAITESFTIEAYCKLTWDREMFERFAKEDVIRAAKSVTDWEVSLYDDGQDCHKNPIWRWKDNTQGEPK